MSRRAGASILLRKPGSFEGSPWVRVGLHRGGLAIADRPDVGPNLVQFHACGFETCMELANRHYLIACVVKFSNDVFGRILVPHVVRAAKNALTPSGPR